jgi:hypothetical protein
VSEHLKARLAHSYSGFLFASLKLPGLSALPLLLVRVYRSIDALAGTDKQKHNRMAWMRSPNTALGGVPAVLIEQRNCYVWSF